MNAAHLHLMLVHTAIVVVPLATLIFLFGWYKGNTTLRVLSVTLFCFSALTVIPAFLTGEGAEEIVETIPQISEHAVEEHEEAGDKALWVTILLGLISLSTLMIKNRSKNTQTVVLTCTALLAIASSVLLAYSGWEGGKIMHPEAFSETTPLPEIDEDRD